MPSRMPGRSCWLGAGGGYDIFSGLPLYFGLKSLGRRFTSPICRSRVCTPRKANVWGRRWWKSPPTSRAPALLPGTAPGPLAGEAGDRTPIYGIDRTGARPIAEAYRTLQERLKPDAVILVDGGTDSLMRGDEAGLGTPEEDIASIAAVDRPRYRPSCWSAWASVWTRSTASGTPSFWKPSQTSPAPAASWARGV